MDLIFYLSFTYGSHDTDLLRDTSTITWACNSFHIEALLFNSMLCTMIATRSITKGMTSNTPIVMDNISIQAILKNNSVKKKKRNEKKEKERKSSLNQVFSGNNTCHILKLTLRKMHNWNIFLTTTVTIGRNLSFSFFPFFPFFPFLFFSFFSTR